MQDFGEVAEKLRRSTVQVRNGHGSGSGVLWDAAGTVVTNAHVAGSGPLEVELWNGTRATARLVAASPASDLATLRIASCGHAQPAVVGDSARIRPGDLVVAVGNPLGFIGAASAGVIHGVGPVRGFGSHAWIQSSVRLAPGNSGGPLAGASGELIGINTMIAASGRSAIALAIPTSRVLAFLKGSADTGTLGVTVREVAIGTRLGLLVLETMADGAAERASIFPGDVLTGAENTPFRSVSDLAHAIPAARGGRLTLHFRRGGAVRERSVTVQLLAPRVASAA